MAGNSGTKGKGCFRRVFSSLSRRLFFRRRRQVQTLAPNSIVERDSSDVFYAEINGGLALVNLDNRDSSLLSPHVRLEPLVDGPSGVNSTPVAELYSEDDIKKFGLYISQFPPRSCVKKSVAAQPQNGEDVKPATRRDDQSTTKKERVSFNYLKNIRYYGFGSDSDSTSSFEDEEVSTDPSLY